MYRSVLALLFAAVLLLGGCAVGQQTVPKEKSGQETNIDGAAFDRSDEEITYMVSGSRSAINSRRWKTSDVLRCGDSTYLA